MDNCPSAELVDAFVMQEVSPNEAHHLELHFDQCCDCSTLIGHLASPAALGPGRLEPRRIGRYEVLAVLGRGAMGTVLRARDQELGRDLAIKVMRSGVLQDAPRERLVAEARVLASLTAPNVVSVYDVGASDGHHYIAMELVDGVNLREWLASESRLQPRLEDIIAVLAQAAEGLAAAHSAGIVHRDFKPENVMVSRLGFTKVVDFGLASAQLPEQFVHSDVSFDDEALEVTRSRELVGTPVYMAPEMLQGRPVDARSDQYSFCVTLYESISGHRPFVGRTLRELADSVQAGLGEMHDAIPKHLHNVLKRGLSVRPQDRYPDMNSLRQELCALPPHWRRLRYPALAFGAVAVAACLAILSGHSKHSCDERVSKETAAFWGDAQKDNLKVSFQAVSGPFAESMRVATQDALEAYARQWRSAGVDACRAENAEDFSGTALIASRRQCLEDLRFGFNALVAQFDSGLGSKATNLVERALSAVQKLDPVSVCSDPSRLAKPALSVTGSDSETLRIGLAEVQALSSVGRTDALPEIVGQLVQEAEVLGDPALLARALGWRSEVKHRRGDNDAAESDLHRVVELAAQAGDDHALASALVRQMYLLIVTRNKPNQALAVAPAAHAAIVNAGSAASLTARWHQRMSNAHKRLGNISKAHQHIDKAIDLYDESDSLHLATALASQAQILVFEGRYSEAETVSLRVLQLDEARFGTGHPELCSTLNSLSLSARSCGDFQAARAYATRSVSILENARGPEDAELDYALNALAGVELLNGDFEKGVKLLERALVVAEKASGPRARRVGMGLINIGSTQLELDRWHEAHQSYARAYEILLEIHGDKHPVLAYATHGIGESHLGAGRLEDAVPYLEVAIRLAGNPALRGAAEFALARVFRKQGHHEQALSHAQDAAKQYAGAENVTIKEHDALRRWLEGHL